MFSAFFSLVQLLVRVTILLWPLAAWWYLREHVERWTAGSDFQFAALTAAPLALLALVLVLRLYDIGSPLTLVLAALGTLLAGGYAIWLEYLRWQPFIGQPGYSFGFIIQYLDYPLVAVAVLCAAGAVAALVMERTGDFGLFGESIRRRSRTAHGSARWLSIRDALGILGEGSLVIGEACDPRLEPHKAGSAPLLRFDGRGHLLTVAGSGSGKTVSVAVPNCLEWAHNLVVHDPKGELAQLCRAARERRGQAVRVLDPSRPDGDSVNVLDWLDPSTDHVVENARAVVSWLGRGEEPKGENAYFENAGQNLLLALILDLVCDPGLPPQKRTLTEVRRRVADPDLVYILEFIAKRDPEFSFGAAQQFAGELAGIARTAEKQWAGVQAHASELTAWLAIPSLARLVCGEGRGATLSVRDITEGPVDVFVCVPLKTLDSTPAVARLIMGALLNAIYERYLRHRTFERRTLFLIDEMPRLRRMELLETARDAGRGLGVTLWGIVQDMGQLEKHYGKEGLRGWMESCQIRTFFGVSDYETAEYLSKSLGEATLETETEGRNRGISRGGGDLFGSFNSGRATNRALVGRALMKPDEVMRMRVDEAGVPDEQIVLVRGRPALRCGMAKWFRRAEMLSLVTDE